MPQFSVTFQGLDKLITGVENMKDRVPGAANEMMAQLGKDTKGVMDDHTPIGTRETPTHKPGTLKKGNTLTELDNGFELSNDVEYASYVEFGTRKMSPRPYLAPAVEFGIQELQARAPKVFEE